MPWFCLDKRILGIIAILTVSVLIAAPHMIWTALSLLVLAACPLSMLAMGLFMAHRGQRSYDSALSPSGGVAPIDVPYRTMAPPDAGTQVAGLRRQLDQINEHQAALNQRIDEIAASLVNNEGYVPTVPDRTGVQ